MILTCPECATRYFIDAEAVGPEGRTVRCSACSASWRQEPTGPSLKFTAVHDLESGVAPDAAAGKGAATPIHRSLRAEVEARRRTKQAVAAGVVWAGLAAGVALTTMGAVVFRTQVVQAWPATAGAYAFLKMPVNPTGFAIEEVQGGPALTEGRLAIVTSGVLRNVQDEARAAPPVRVSLYDHSGRRLASRVVASADGRVSPGDARVFKASFIDPPNAAQVQVEFAFDVHPPRSARPKPAPGWLRGAAPTRTAAEAARSAVVAAKPLPADSPYALHPVPHG